MVIILIPWLNQSAMPLDPITVPLYKPAVCPLKSGSMTIVQYAAQQCCALLVISKCNISMQVQSQKCTVVLPHSVINFYRVVL